MRTDLKQPSVDVVYPAALFDRWEVVKEPSDEAVFFDTREEATAYAKALALTEGKAVVKVENWFGDTESVLEVQPQTGQSVAPITS